MWAEPKSRATKIATDDWGKIFEEKGILIGFTALYYPQGHFLGLQKIV